MYRGVCVCMYNYVHVCVWINMHIYMCNYILYTIVITPYLDGIDTCTHLRQHSYIR